MAHAFVALAPLRFLWAMKQAGLPQGLQLSDIPLGDNCMIVPWVDQNVRTNSSYVFRLVFHALQAVAFWC